VGFFFAPMNLMNSVKQASRFENARRSGVLPCVAIALLCAATACATTVAVAQTSEAPSSASPVYREIVDETGRTETIYALGLQDKLVGDTDYCDYPPDAQKKPKVGGALNPSLEQIAYLKPDLVVVTRHLNSLDTVHSLDTLGIPSYGTDPKNIDEIVASTKRLGEVLGAPEAGASVADDLRKRLEVLRQKIAALPPKRALFIVWTDPLISVGKDTFIADALKRAGATSIIDSSQDWPQVSLEEVAHLQPDVLVFADSHSEAVPRNLDQLATRPGWRIIDAVRNKNYAVISDAVNRPAPRIVSAIEDLAAKLHPEAFADKPAVLNAGHSALKDAEVSRCLCAR
jgi:iron complex transport system substrate-binding protein